METRLSPLRFVVAALAALVALLGASILLPHDRYHRFQAHHDVTTRKADWIYERLHYDDTPIDVAFIGTSRSAGGVSGPLVEQEYCTLTGRKIHVANLALPATGRNMHYAIAKEAARTKAPALTLVELNDVESRRPHGGFIFLADATDVLSAPVWINFNYVSDLLRLPGRQVALFMQSLTGKAAIRPAFDPDAYAGSHFDRTEEIVAIDGRTRSRQVIHNAAAMEAMRLQRQTGLSPQFILPKSLARLEYRFSRRYLKKIEQVTTGSNGKLAYVYLPAFAASAPSAAILEALDIGLPVISVTDDIETDPSKWFDATHLNRDGAQATSRRIAAAIAGHYPKLGRKSCK